jgi:hypothetical protein
MLNVPVRGSASFEQAASKVFPPEAWKPLDKRNTAFHRYGLRLTSGNADQAAFARNWLLRTIDA